ncbi:hypothetical protein F5Y00DRAFT_71612 [Daldinia vernicosa]|uniref:uncharacterized protein n=1 Tax=Daldinia vernicosa TaxID=114800 RepID=UPI002008BAD0|nr:uncharacterized protein F5Y00DRAFT_71612 [Daldinia vernicosa]KAI0849330.1 hypothetical protein F5Y00DRAFT_71612 [Daldinia vernicosa]
MRESFLCFTSFQYYRDTCVTSIGIYMYLALLFTCVINTHLINLHFYLRASPFFSSFSFSFRAIVVVIVLPHILGTLNQGAPRMYEVYEV